MQFVIISVSTVLFCSACSFFLSIVKFGENVERSPLWAEVKTYFHIAYWILNYRPGVTTQLENCEYHLLSFFINC